MLVLKRRPNQRIEIGKDIVITVCWIQGLSVKIGVEAPENVEVWRGEIADERRRKEGKQ